MSDASPQHSASTAAPSSRRRWLLPAAALAATALGSGVGWWQWQRKTGATADSTPEALPMLRAQALVTPEGQPISAQTWLGKPLVLNFWAPWCPPCVQEMPELDAFARTSPNWQVLGLALDNQAAVQAFAKLHPVSFVIAVAGLEGLPLVRAFGNPGGGLPYTVLISANGQVLHTKAGATTQAELLRWTNSV